MLLLRYHCLVDFFLIHHHQVVLAQFCLRQFQSKPEVWAARAQCISFERRKIDDSRQNWAYLLISNLPKGMTGDIFPAKQPTNPTYWHWLPFLPFCLWSSDCLSDGVSVRCLPVGLFVCSSVSQSASQSVSPFVCLSVFLIV